MKKIGVTLALLILIGSANLFSLGGLGVQIGGAPGSTAVGGFAVTFKPDTMNWVFGADLGFSSNIFAIAAFADTWLLEKPVVETTAGPITWYAGWGAYANVFLIEGYDFKSWGKAVRAHAASGDPAILAPSIDDYEKLQAMFAIGGRAPIGVKMLLLDNTLELYLQAALALGISFSSLQKSNGDAVGAGFDWGVPIVLGFRYWF